MFLQNFLEAHRLVVLHERFDLLKKAANRAKAESNTANPNGDDTLRYLYQKNLLPNVVLPCAQDLLKMRLYSRSELRLLVALFPPKGRRLAGSADNKVLARTTEANRRAWSEVRKLVSPKLVMNTPEEIAKSLHRNFTGPLVNHLIRETILWAYALSRLPESGLSPTAWLEQQGVLPPRGATQEAQMVWLRKRPELTDKTWVPVFTAKMSALEEELKQPVPCNEVSDEDFSDETVERESSIHPGSFQTSNYDDDIDKHLRSFMRWMEKTQGKHFEFGDKLLLCFTVSGYSQLYALAERDVPMRRTAIANGLQRKGIILERDQDTGNALSWWHNCASTTRMFGTEFEQRFRAARKQWAMDLGTVPTPHWKRPRDEFVRSCEAWVHAAPQSALAQLFTKHRNALSTFSGKASSELLTAETRVTFEQAIEDETARICTHVESTNAITFDDLSEADREKASMLGNIAADLQRLSDLGAPRPTPETRVQKYFTALWSKNRNRTQPPNAATLSNQSWIAATKRLYADQELMGDYPRHWRNLWKRIQPEWWHDEGPPPDRGMAANLLNHLSGSLRLEDAIPDSPAQDNADKHREAWL